MKADRWKKLKQTFSEVLELDQAEREAYLKKVDDEKLIEEVRSLLEAYTTAGPLNRSLEELRLSAFSQLPARARGKNNEEQHTGQDQLIGQTVSHYKIEEKLGGGGMGIVYRARDRHLGRSVAIKFLPPALSINEKAKQRFVQEAKAAAALDHPNIAVIHEIDETDDGQLFIAMAYYKGKTLREKIAGGPLPIEEALGYAAQIARGLAAAHAKGILHRDVKPANVMVTGDGGVKILDFGLAKLEGSTHLTRPGTQMGTVAYMSPEQARGEEVDRRTDLWSLGAVLYEMLTGERPFGGEREQAMLYNVCHEEPEPVKDLRTEISAPLAAVVTKCLQKDPARRYPDMPALLVALRDRSQKPEHTPGARAEEAVPSIAVLPFADMSPGRDQGYFCEGMAEEILNALDRMEGLRVAARTSSFQFKEVDTDIRELGRRLKVRTVLEGSVRKAGRRLRITVQLINVADGYHLWSERYDRQLEDVFAIQDEIAENTVRALQGVLTEEDRHILQKMPRADVKAYDYYLRGRRFFYKKTDRDHEFARQMFARAIEVDPGYARAYAGLSDCCALLYKHFDHRPEHLEQADEASRKAVELAPELGETHASRGMVLSLSGEDDAAEREFETALRLSPRLYQAYYLYAIHQGYLKGNHERAAQLYEQASKVQPEDYEAPLLQASFCRGAGRDEKARAAYRRGLRLARRYLELNPDDVRAIYLSANAMVALGKKEHGLEWAARAQALESAPSAVFLNNMAAIYALAGEVERGMDFLEKAVQAGYPLKEPVENDPDLQPLHDHPRFQALLQTLEPRPGYPRPVSQTQERNRILKRPAVLVPFVLLLLLAAAVLMPRMLTSQSERVQALLPQIEQQAQAGNYAAAYDLADRAEDHLESDSTLARWMPVISDSLTVTSQPEGARVYLQRFAPNEEGQSPDSTFVGTTPIRDLRVARSDYRVWIEKEGYVPVVRTASSTLRRAESRFLGTSVADFNPAKINIVDLNIEVRLLKAGAAPENMVFVPGGSYQLVSAGAPTKAKATLDDYLIDKYEVSNEQYQTFIEAGGYANKTYWKHPFVKEGRPLSWEEAMQHFTDRTDLPGPRHWTGQEYPNGKGTHPVTNITWYEAAAYAEWAGKRLPTVFEWEKAARAGAYTHFEDQMMPWGLVDPEQTSGRRANFSSNGTEPVDSHPFGASPYGAYNMAGNVKEWGLNETTGGYPFTGGSWQDPMYLFTEYGVASGFFASPTLGFRCARDIGDRTEDQEAMRIDLDRQTPTYDPVDEVTFRRFLSYYEYDRRPLNTKIIERKETADWTWEKVRFAGINGDRVLAYLYLPKRAAKPFQSLIFVPNSAAFSGMGAREQAELFLAPHIKAGRAVFTVVMKGMIERPWKPSRVFPDPSSVRFRELMVRHATELSRGIDYLATRDDIDMEKLAYISFSWGAGSRLPFAAVENRYSSVVLVGGGIDERMQPTRPEASNINFAPYIEPPTLLLNGKYDEEHPYRTRALPLWNLLSEPKKFVRVEGGHHPPPEARVPVINRWLDETLGPVERE